MDANTLKTSVESRMHKAIESLTNDLKKIRTGRANVSMLDSVSVNYYGSATPLNQVASVTCPDAKSFLITPWESSVLKEIEASIVKSDLGLAPMNDGKAIRLKVPDLTEERRKDLAKQVNKVAEDARVAVRMVRRDGNEEIKKAAKDKAIGEDDAKRFTEDVQKSTDKFIGDIDKISKDKEKEIITL